MIIFIAMERETKRSSALFYDLDQEVRVVSILSRN